VRKTGRIGQEFAIDQEAMNIGRWDADKGVLPEIDLTNDDPGNYISRRHARIFLRSGEYFIEDMGSMNGTFVNKSPRLSPNSPMKLQNGDEIVMGRTFFAFAVE
jgi:serine/threonine-protein kinase